MSYLRPRILVVAFMIFLFPSVLVWGHGKAKRTAHQVTPAEQRAYDEARPVFEKHCFRCHTAEGKKRKKKVLEHLDMTRYPFTGHHAHEIAAAIRQVLGVGRTKKPTMPPDDLGALNSDELALIRRWADAFDHAAAGSSQTR